MIDKQLTKKLKCSLWKITAWLVGSRAGSRASLFLLTHFCGSGTKAVNPNDSELKVQIQACLLWLLYQHYVYGVWAANYMCKTSIQSPLFRVTTRWQKIRLDAQFPTLFGNPANYNAVNQLHIFSPSTCRKIIQVTRVCLSLCTGCHKDGKKMSCTLFRGPNTAKKRTQFKVDDLRHGTTSHFAIHS